MTRLWRWKQHALKARAEFRFFKQAPKQWLSLEVVAAVCDRREWVESTLPSTLLRTGSERRYSKLSHYQKKRNRCLTLSFQAQQNSAMCRHRDAELLVERAEIPMRPQVAD